MKKLATQWAGARRWIQCALLALASLLIFFMVWVLVVRPATGKSLSVKLCDSYELTSEPITQSASQTFTIDRDMLALAFVFGIPGEQPVGDLELTLTDADTGEVLATSTGDMINILPGQYTGLGLSQLVEQDPDRTYRVTLTPHYEGEGVLQLCYSDGAVLDGESLTVNGRTVNGTAALLATSEQIGRFLSVFYWAVALLLTALLCFAFLAATCPRLRLSLACFALILGLGTAFTMVLPPYAAPDEQYHLNESFTLACWMANRVSGDDWVMTHIPTNYSYRRAGDVDDIIQNQETTVFTWRQFSRQLLSTTDEPMNSHWEYSDPQADSNPQMYLVSALGVLLAFALHLGFVPALLLGRLFNLIAFALAASYAIHKTPVGRPLFVTVSLLPMTLHLAASFSRDSLLLGVCFLFTALCLDAAFGPHERLRLRDLVLLGVCGLLIAPCKAVYFPLVLLVFLIPAARLGKRAKPLRLGFLACCAALFVAMNLQTFAGFFSADVQATNEANQQAAQQAAEEQLAAQEQAVAQQKADAADARSEAAQAESEPQTGAEGDAAPASATAEEDAAAETQPAGTAAAQGLPIAEAAALLADNEQARGVTAEGLVLRTYAVTVGQLPSAEDVEFWSTGMERIYTDLCGFMQHFFLSEDYLAQPRTDEALLRDLTYVIHDRAPTAEDCDYWLKYMALFPTPVEKLNCYLLEYTNVHPYDEIGIVPGDVDLTQTTAEYEDLYERLETKYAEDAALHALPEEDTICYDAAYILQHPLATLKLIANSLLEHGDHYIRSLVGGSLSYYSLDLAWGWVLALYLLLAAACLPVEGQVPLPGRARAVAALCALACCGLTVLGCISWTPTYFTSIYGLQGRYFLPVLPLALLALRPRLLAARRELSPALMVGVTAVNAGVLLNAMMAVIAR